MQKEIKNISLARLYDSTELTLSVQIIKGQQPGPTMFLSGAIHGDELTGVAVINDLINHRRFKDLKGTVLALPIVNVFGFNAKSRYLPDRRDLNRSFPGYKKGSLAARMAHIILDEIVSKADFGIDFHSASLHKTNLPQIRTCLDFEANRKLANAFGSQVVIDAKLREGSLRHAAYDKKIPMLVFEGGEALRIEDSVIREGVQGTLALMSEMGMLPAKASVARKTSYVAKSTYWVRTPVSGIAKLKKKLGSHVKKGDKIALVSNAFGAKHNEILSPSEGIVIGLSCLPLVNKGDAIVHIATFEDSDVVRDLADDLLDTDF